MRKVIFLLLVLLMFSTASSAATQKYNFTMENYTGLNFENGTYFVELIEIARPLFVKVNLTYSGTSRVNSLFDGEAPITFYQIKLSSSSITSTNAVIDIEFPDGWSYPRTYTVPKPAVGTPNIVVKKSADKTNINVGDIVSFTIKVENTGNATAYNLTLVEPLPKGFSNAYGFPPVVKDKLDAGESQELYYGLKAEDSGTINFEPTLVKYGSKTIKSNSFTITVAGAAEAKAKLVTTIRLDKNNVYTGDTIQATVRIANDGNAPAKAVLIDGAPPLGIEAVEGDFRQVYDTIAPGGKEEYRIVLKANEAGSYNISLRTVYNDAPAGVLSGEPVTVTRKEGNYAYIAVPIIIIIAGIVLFTMRRHKEYSY